MAKKNVPLETIMDVANILEPPEGIIEFRSRTSGQPWFDRVDPLWVGFGANPAYGWRSAAKIEWVPIWSPYGLKMVSRWVPEFSLMTGAKWVDKNGRIVRICAALLSYRVLTTQQISGLTGLDPSNSHKALNEMMKVGLLERCQMVARHNMSNTMPYLWRLRLDTKEYATWFKSLDHELRWYLTFGQEAGSGGHDRHDVVVAEVVLRAAEVLPGLQAICGERASGAKVMLPGEKKAVNRGDAAIIRNDGLRVILEVTTQPTIPAVRKKMAHWGRLLGEHGGVNQTGVVVVFLSMQYSGGGVELLQKSYTRIMTPEGLGGDSPASPDVLRLARGSVTVAGWKDWFPAPWCISERFRDLEVYWSDRPGLFHPIKLWSENKDDGGFPFNPKPDGRRWDEMRERRQFYPAVPRWIEDEFRWEAAGPDEVAS